MIKKKVFVALSGGVDSAVSLALLKEEGYDVKGVYMKNWSGDDFGIQSECPWEEDIKDASKVCDTLGVEFISYNFEKEYRKKVVDYFFEEYAKGRTPNPDIMCNKEIKFKLFLEKALENGADFIATGHYARKIQKIDFSDFSLFTGNDSIKNQVYFLNNINQEQLAKTFFPVGCFEKKEVRQLAKKFNLPNQNKKDSQGICFIGQIDILKFLMSRIPEKVGNIIDIDSYKKVGEHRGVYFYTVGQRKGLGISSDLPYFVCGKEVESNTLFVCKGHDNKNLIKDSISLENLHFISKFSFFNIVCALNPQIRTWQDIYSLKEIKLSGLNGQIRYQQSLLPIEILIRDVDIKESNGSIDLGGKIEVKFKDGIWAVASGQSLVFFNSSECLGGGVIC